MRLVSNVIVRKPWPPCQLLESCSTHPHGLQMCRQRSWRVRRRLVPPFPRLRPWIDRCPAPDLAHVFQAVVDLWEHEDAEITPSLVMTALGAHPTRNLVSGIVEFARKADQPAHLFESAVSFLERHEQQREIARLQAEIQTLDARAASDPAAANALGRSCG